MIGDLPFRVMSFLPENPAPRARKEYLTPEGPDVHPPHLRQPNSPSDRQMFRPRIFRRWSPPHPSLGRLCRGKPEGVVFLDRFLVFHRRESASSHFEVVNFCCNFRQIIAIHRE
jgi:hypothetical protein